MFFFFAKKISIYHIYIDYLRRRLKCSQLLSTVLIKAHYQLSPHKIGIWAISMRSGAAVSRFIGAPFINNSK